MAKQPYSWAKVERGDIISFRYQGSDGRSTKRSVIVLEKKLKHPNSKNLLLHGYQLDVRNVPAIRSESALLNLFEKIGTPQEVDKEDNIIKILVEGRSPQVYSRTRALIKKYGIYRTYYYDRATRNQVFLEPVKIDPKVLDAIL
tara:strand:- start:1027 stop:1458 length:432 start_codon:yes stop_codon:yes gene_type:complete